MKREVLQTDTAPKPLGPYSQAIKTGDFLFVSGQIGYDPKTERMRDGAEAQAEQAIVNLSNICKAAGTALENTVRLNIYLVDLSYFSVLNLLIGRAFPSDPPARSVVGVNELPRGSLIEIDAVVQL